MKKNIKKLLLLTTLLFSKAIYSNTKTEKTFFLPRSHGVNLAMEYSTWKELLEKNTIDQFGTNFQATPFYQESINASYFGKYFGVKHKRIFKLNASQENDVRGTYIIHDTVAARSNSNLATIQLDPKQRVYGLRLDYFQNLEKLMEGLYLKVAIPIISVKNNLHFIVSDGTQKDLFLEYFKGNVYQKRDGNGLISNQPHSSSQKKLTRALIDKENDTVGVAEIGVIAGYNLFEHPKYASSIMLGLDFPTSDEPDGINVFEPMPGNANHWAMVFGLDASAKLWEGIDKNLKINFAINSRYLFQSTQKRTLRIKDMPYSQYYLIGELDKFERKRILFTPAADILTRNVNVSPKWQIDSILNFSYHHSGFNFDLGYNFFWKNKEQIGLKDTWVDGKYGILHPEQTLESTNANAKFEFSQNPVAASLPGGAEKIINTNDIDVNCAQTPAQCTHKIYGSLGYIFLDYSYPFMLGFGGGYEFAETNSMENWQIWTKMGITF